MELMNTPFSMPAQLKIPHFHVAAQHDLPSENDSQCRL
jgi:hypothetical protein